MSVPTPARSSLDTKDTTLLADDKAHIDGDWSLKYDQYLRQMGAVKSVVLQDDQGQLQVIFGADSLLDIQGIRRQLGRELHAASAIAMRSFCQQHKVKTVPALPLLPRHQILVDRHLLSKEELRLDPGDYSPLMSVSRAQFQQLTDSAQIIDAALPLAPLEAQLAHATSTDDILASVRDFTKVRIKQRLEETLELPPLPETAQRIIKLRANPNADISDLAQIVETDPSLAAQVVSWAASPYYSAPGKIKSIHDAIVRVLGFDMVLNLALGLSLGKTLSLPKEGTHGALPYWQQAVYMAATIEGLVSAIPREERPSFGMAYLCGLLHNFGYLVLAELFPPYFTNYCDLSDANPYVHPQVIERHMVGVTREQLGSALLSLWNMPTEVVNGIRFQSDATYAGEDHLYAKLLFVAKRLLQEHRILPGVRQEIPVEVFAALHLDPEKARQTVVNIIESSDELRHIAHELSPSRT